MDSYHRQKRDGETLEEYKTSLLQLVALSLEREFPESQLSCNSTRETSVVGVASARQSGSVSATEKHIGATSSRRYKKRSGVANGTGESYEWKTLTLVLLRMLASGFEFRMASNMEAAGAFDDLVIRYRKNPSDPWTLSCMQLKHKRAKHISKTDFLKLSDDFSIIKYCSSQEAVKCSESEDIQSSDQQVFIIYTNANTKADLVDEVESNELLSTGGRVVSFKPGGEVYRELCEWVDFKEDLTALHGQVDGLSDKEVETRLKNELKCVAYRNKAVTSHKEGLLKYPTLPKLKELLKKLEPVSDKETYFSFLAELRLYTGQVGESGLDEKIKDEFARVWVQTHSPEAKEMLHTLKAKVKSWWQQESVYLTQDSPLWLDVIKSQTEALSKSTIDRLTAVGAEFQEDFLKVFHRAIDRSGILHISVGKRTAASSLRVHQALTRFGAPDLHVLHVNVKALLAREDDVLSAWATRWCHVLVVECDVDLDREKAARISARVLQVVARDKDKKLLVLIAPEKHELNVQLYHAESYTRYHDNFEWCELTDNTRARLLSRQIVVNGIQSPHNLSKLVDKGFLNKADLEVMSQLLQEDLSCGKILDSKSAYFVTRRLQESSDGDPFVVNSVRDVPGKVVLVVAEPGMGKSTLFTHLAQSAKAEDPSAWVVHIKLNDCVQCLQEVDVEHVNEVAAKWFLEQSELSPANSFEKLLFGSFESKLTIFIDGVDEVCPYYEKEVFALLGCLKDMKILNLWVASRPVFQAKLENCLGKKSFQVVAFSSVDRTSFYSKIFLGRFPKSSPEQCSQPTENLLAWLSDSLGKDNPILGVPLINAIIAEIFQDSMFAENCDDNELKKLKSFNITDLYKSFVLKKFNIYCKEKKKTVSRELAANKHDEDNLLKQMHRNHSLAALRVLFSPEEISTLEFVGKDRFAEDLASFLQEVSDGREKVGIIDNVIDGVPHFVHRSFAEYFAATWLAEHFKTNAKFLEKILFDHAHMLVSIMFSRSLAEDHPLHVAVCDRDLKMVQSILTTKLNPRVNALDTGGRTPLHLAVYLSGTDRHHDYADIVKFLLHDHKAKLDVTDEVLGWVSLRYAEWSRAWGVLQVILEQMKNVGNEKESLIQMVEAWPNPDSNLMLDAARGASVSVVRYLVAERGGKLDCRGLEGETLIHKAAEGGNAMMIKHLLKKGQGKRHNLARKLDVGALNNQGLTALQVAAQKGMYGAMAALLDAKASYDVRSSKATNYQLNASLLCAAYAGDLASVKKLLEAGASARYRNSNSDTAAEVAKHRGHKEVMDWLLFSDTKNKDTPLHKACRRGKLKNVSAILSRGTDIEWNGCQGLTPLAVALQVRRMDVAELLLENGASTEFRDDGGRTPLHHASHKGRCEVAALLLRHGADATAKDNKHQTPLHLATLSSNVAVVTLLLEKGASVECCDEEGWTPLHYASYEGSAEVATLLLFHGADVAAEDNMGQTPLHVAARWSKVAVLTLLLENGASVEWRDEEGWTPLHRASLKGSVEVAALLLRHGADVMAEEDCKCWTPLQIAVWRNNVAVVKLLLEKGASVECRDEQGWTPLHHASSKGSDEIVVLLLRHGADVTMLDNEGQTPLDLATSRHCESIVCLLTQPVGS